MLILLGAALACTKTVPSQDRVEPTFLYVELLSGETGSAEAPLPFTTEPQPFSLRVTAQDLHGDPYPMSGDLTVKALPGVREGSPYLSMVDGVWEGEVRIRNGFGPTRIWVSDEGDLDGSTVIPCVSPRRSMSSRGFCRASRSCAPSVAATRARPSSVR